MAEGRAGVRGGRGGRTAYVDEVYERDDAARDARVEERFQRLKRRVASVIQRLEALEVGRLPRRQPFKPSLPTEVDFSDGVSITKPLPGNHQSAGRTRAIKVANRDSRLWLEIDWESPPKFDEYPDEEEAVIHEVEENVKDEPMKEIIAEEDIVQVAGKIARAEPMVGLVPNCASASFWCNKELSSILVGKNINPSYMEALILDTTNEINAKLFCKIHKHNRLISSFSEDQIELSKDIVLVIFEDCSFKFRFEKINLKNKLDADKFRQIQLYKLEDEFLQDGENDAE
ncbi:hypothetical protein RHGRI_025710 [Rhododendron griersonianum]|uniref:Uncharacterized protein n=1 Tax=Rhododendron griersonianum TaxID=479676 RepID=A0AAV6IUN3_9ERIC|nr:hypothetical protein RHGRI_025710 [Rhododendron griersonianum]